MTKNVWYRSTPGSRIEDRGTVNVEGGNFRFAGKKGTVTGRVLAAATRSAGFNNWIKATYEADGQTREAFFLVKDLLGWGGMLGGNKELREALEAAAQAN
ncbi:MAG: hypothetical protein ACJ75I_01110 [Solirubrobacterales bacterium]